MTIILTHRYKRHFNKQFNILNAVKNELYGLPVACLFFNRWAFQSWGLSNFEFFWLYKLL